MWFFLSRIRGAAALALAGSAMAGAVLIGSAASAQAHAVAPTATAKSCSISKVWHKLGPTYVEELKVTDTTCGTGETVIKDYNACRIRSGGVKGKCRTAVDRGFTCKEERSTGPDQFVAKATCQKSREAVVFTYSEDFD